MEMHEDRRRRRSQDPLVALHYQLAYARSDCDLEAIVVADESGVVVAGAGSWATCEELAAYAPLLISEDRGGGVWHEPGKPDGKEPPSFDASSRLSSLRLEVEVKRVRIGTQQVLLCAQGGVMRSWAMQRAAQGVERILRQAA